MGETLPLEAAALQVLSPMQDNKDGWISGSIVSQSDPLSSWNEPTQVVSS